MLRSILTIFFLGVFSMLFAACGDQQNSNTNPEMCDSDSGLATAGCDVWNNNSDDLTDATDPDTDNIEPDTSPPDVLDLEGEPDLEEDTSEPDMVEEDLIQMDMEDIGDIGESDADITDDPDLVEDEDMDGEDEIDMGEPDAPEWVEGDRCEVETAPDSECVTGSFGISQMLSYETRGEFNSEGLCELNSHVEICANGCSNGRCLSKLTVTRTSNEVTIWDMQEPAQIGAWDLCVTGPDSVTVDYFELGRVVGYLEHHYQILVDGEVLTSGMLTQDTESYNFDLSDLDEGGLPIRSNDCVNLSMVLTEISLSDYPHAEGITLRGVDTTVLEIPIEYDAYFDQEFGGWLVYEAQPSMNLWIPSGQDTSVSIVDIDYNHVMGLMSFHAEPYQRGHLEALTIRGNDTSGNREITYTLEARINYRSKDWRFGTQFETESQTFSISGGEAHVLEIDKDIAHSGILEISFILVSVQGAVQPDDLFVLQVNPEDIVADVSINHGWRFEENLAFSEIASVVFVAPRQDEGQSPTEFGCLNADGQPLNQCQRMQFRSDERCHGLCDLGAMWFRGRNDNDWNTAQPPVGRFYITTSLTQEHQLIVVHGTNVQQSSSLTTLTLPAGDGVVTSVELTAQLSEGDYPYYSVYFFLEDVPDDYLTPDMVQITLEQWDLDQNRETIHPLIRRGNSVMPPYSLFPTIFHSPELMIDGGLTGRRSVRIGDEDSAEEIVLAEFDLSSRYHWGILGGQLVCRHGTGKQDPVFGTTELRLSGGANPGVSVQLVDDNWDDQTLRFDLPFDVESRLQIPHSDEEPYTLRIIGRNPIQPTAPTSPLEIRCEMITGIEGDLTFSATFTNADFVEVAVSPENPTEQFVSLQVLPPTE